MKRQIIALLLMTIMVASVSGAVGLAAATTKVDALKATVTATTLTVSKRNPYVDEQVTFTASLSQRALSNHHIILVPISGETVTIYHYVNSVTRDPTTHRMNCHVQRVDDYAATTVNGAITWTTSWASAGTTTYYANFAGDSTYAKSHSGPVTIHVLIPTQLTLDAPYNQQSHPRYNTTQLSGNLTDLNSNGLNKYERIVITAKYQWKRPADTTWTQGRITVMATGKANLQGAFKDVRVTTATNSTKLLVEYYDFQAHFAGDSTYGASNSNVVNLP